MKKSAAIAMTAAIGFGLTQSALAQIDDSAFAGEGVTIVSHDAGLVCRPAVI